MKKLFTALTAALMLGSLLTAPVSADVTDYKMGDVNMDGVIDSSDAQLVLADYLNVLIVGMSERRVLTEEQVALGNVVVDGTERENALTCDDAHVILNYYLDGFLNDEIQQMDIVDYGRQKFPHRYGLS